MEKADKFTRNVKESKLAMCLALPFTITGFTLALAVAQAGFVAYKTAITVREAYFNCCSRDSENYSPS